MRILIADRNAWLLESISHSFAPQFSIQTGATLERCNELLGQVDFDLVVISEKLADGRGLQLLAQIARNSPDTLRVFAARRSRLQLLKGKLGPFGLFRTLSYPINPRELLSALTLARSGLEASEVPVAAAVPVRVGTSIVVPPAAAPRSAELLSLVSARALFTTDVPKRIGLKISTPARTHTPALTRTPVHSVRPQTTNVAPQPPRAQHREPPPARHPEPQPVRRPEPRTARPQVSAVRSAPPQSQALQSMAVDRTALSSAALRSIGSMSARPDPDAFLPLPSVSVYRSSLRTKVALGTTIALIFVATTLTLRLLDASAHVSHASAPPVAKVEQPAATVAPPSPAPVVLAPAFQPTPRVAQHVQPKPHATEADVAPANPKLAASTTPIADPSTFGSEAYEPIYSN